MRAARMFGPSVSQGGWHAWRAVAAAVLLMCSVWAQAYDRRVQTVATPDTVLQRADGPRLKLSEAFAGRRPVVLTFMYSSCQTVCPITNQVMVQLDQLLGAQRSRVQMVSISIDPDHDTVERLKQYARSTGNRGSLFTGDPAGSEAVQRAFDAWRGDKMHHEALFLINPDPSRTREWVRLTGLLTPRELLAELKKAAPDLP